MVVIAALLHFSLLGSAHLHAKPIHAAALRAGASVESWEKRIAPGVVFRMDWDPVTPRTLFALRLSLKSQDYRPLAQLAGKTVYENNPSKGRATVSEMVRDDHALAGINGDFFPFTGDPLNLMVRDGELLSAPFVAKGVADAKRAAFGWGPGFATFGFGKMTSSLEAGGSSFKIEGWDEEAQPDQVTLNTPAAGFVRASAPNVYVVIKTSGAQWAPNSEVRGEVTEVGTDVILRAVEKDTCIVVAAGAGRDKLANLQEGDKVTIKTHTDGFDWNKVTNVIGGGPVLVRDGQVLVDWAEERFREDFAKNRHPRTAIGRTAHDEIWLVAVDGRSKISAGATLEEMATIMKGLGCVDAINLDGGGSTTMNIVGMTVNRPSDGPERPDANGVLILGPLPSPIEESLRLSTVSHDIKPAEKVTLKVLVGPSFKRVVKNADVLWNATGAGWIDQGGTLHLRGAGKIEVTAFVHGQSLRAVYTSLGGEPDRPKGFSAED